MGVKHLLGERIKSLRKSRGYTQERFAEMIDITPRNLSRIELGTNFVSAETLDRIIKALDISADSLFSYDHLKNIEEISNNIENLLNKIKIRPERLKLAYRLLKFIAEDDL